MQSTNEAWETLYRATHPLVMDRIGDEDAVADAYLKLLEEEPEFRTVREMVLWLCAKARGFSLLRR